MQITSAFSHAPSSKIAPGLALTPSLSLGLTQSLRGTGNNQIPSLASINYDKFCEVAQVRSSQTCHMNWPFASTRCWEQEVVWISGLVWVLSRKVEMDFALRSGICQCLPSFKQGSREGIRDPPYINFLAYPLIIPSFLVDFIESLSMEKYWFRLSWPPSSIVWLFKPQTLEDPEALLPNEEFKGSF